MSVNEQIAKMIEDNPVILFIKGTRMAPQCGFSARVIDLLDGYGIEYQTVNVLADPALREGIKQFSNWPTIPQLYIRGEFVGGCDIVTEMNESGELAKVLGVKEQQVDTPEVRITPAAVEALKQHHEGGGPLTVRLEIDRAFNHSLDFAAPRAGDFSIECGPVTLIVDRSSAARANGVVIDFTTGPQGSGFRIDNPNEPPKVKAISVDEVKAWIAGGKPFEFFDVRTADEHRAQNIKEARFLDDAAKAHIEALKKDTALVFHCQSGGRSERAAQHYVNAGFTNVYNLTGGIKAWY